MNGLKYRTNYDKVRAAAVVALVLAAIVLVWVAELSAGFCDDDCAGQCGTDCDCLSCLPALLMVVAPSLDFKHIDPLISWSRASASIHSDPARVSGIEHPPQLFV